MFCIEHSTRMILYSILVRYLNCKLCDRNAPWADAGISRDSMGLQ